MAEDIKSSFRKCKIVREKVEWQRIINYLAIISSALSRELLMDFSVADGKKHSKTSRDLPINVS